MSVVVNGRDALLGATSPRYTATSGAKLLLLTSDTPTFKVVGGTGTPTSATLTATLVGLTTAASWGCTGGVLTGSGDNVRTLTYANMSADTATITATVNEGGQTYTATTVIAKVSNGGDGARGAGHYYATGTWSDAAADTATPGANIVGDRVTISNGTTVTTKYWTGSAWTPDGTVIDGNLLVANSVTAAKINANGLSLKDAAGNVFLDAGTGLDFASRFGTNTTNLPANNATYGADWATNVVGAAAVNTSITNAQSKADSAFTNAGTAQTAANAANNSIADIASDDKFTPSEKHTARKEWNIVVSEKAGINTTAATYPAVSAENTAYNTAFQALGTYLNNEVAYTISTVTPPSWINDANLATTTAIVGATFRDKWKAMYDARQTLLNKISVEAGKVAFWSSIANRPANVAALTGAEAIQNSLISLSGLGFTGATNATYNPGAFANLSGTITAANAASFFAANSLSGTYIANLAADKITAGTFAAGVVYAGSIAANQIAAGTLAAGVVYAGSVAASQVTATNLESISNKTGNLEVTGTMTTANGLFSVSSAAVVSVKSNATGTRAEMKNTGFYVYKNGGPRIVLGEQGSA